VLQCVAVFVAVYGAAFCSQHAWLCLCTCHFVAKGVLLQCVAVRCSMLRCVAVYCIVLQRVAACCRALQCVAVSCSMLQCVAVCCSVL